MYISSMVTKKQKSTVDTQKMKRKESNHITTENHQITKKKECKKKKRPKELAKNLETNE